MLDRRQFVKLSGILSASLALGVSGCGSKPAAGGSSSSDGDSADSSASSSRQKVRVGALKGPTSIGLAYLMDQASSGKAAEDYEFTVAASPDAILPSIIKGDLDIACVPANAAAVLYDKTKGKVSVIDVNTLGVLSVVTADTSIKDFMDLGGRTVYSTGKGASPEYVMRDLLDKAGIADGVTLEFKSEATEVVSLLAQDASAVAVLPQPFVTAALAKNSSLSAPIDLNDVWDKYNPDSKFVMGVTIAQNELIQKYPDVVKTFMKEQAASVKEANDDPEAVAPMVVKAGILDNEKIVAKAIPGSHVVCITGDEMSDDLSGFLSVLYDVDSSSVGGELPPENFYYLG